MAEKYSVIVPVYNSQNSLKELFERLSACFAQVGAEFTVIFIDDNSKDDSWQVVCGLKDEFPAQVKAIRLSKNFGQHNAILCGMHFIDGGNVITIDDDLQIPPEEIPKLIEHQKQTGADVVYGTFKSKKHSILRNFGSYLLGKIFQYFASTVGQGSPFRLIRNEIAEKLTNTNQSLIFLDEALGWFTERIEFVNVDHHKRKEGASGYSFIKLFFHTLNLIVSYTSLPLRVMTYFGLISALVCIGVGIHYIYLKYTYGAELGFTALIVAIFFSASIILLSLGIIGEYIRRLHATQYKKPPFAIRTVIE